MKNYFASSLDRAIQRILCAICIISAATYIWLAFFFLDPVCLLFAASFLAVRFFLSGIGNPVAGFLRAARAFIVKWSFAACMATSHCALRLAAWLNGTPPVTTFSLATILGNTSPHDPADPPCTIADLLDILDRSSGRSLTLKIQGYRITARTVSAVEEFVETHAGREGAVPEVRGWVAQSAQV